MPADKITLYNNPMCPFGHRVAIALKEVGADYESVDVDIYNIPDWYKEKINPEGKLPAIATEGEYLGESEVILEYISDLFTDKNLLPDHPLQRAQVRYAIEFYSKKVNAETYKFLKDSHTEGAWDTFNLKINKILGRFNELLLEQSPTGPYFLGEQFSLADISLAPFIVRNHALLVSVADDYEFDVVKANPRLAEFINGVSSRPSVQETYCGDELTIKEFKGRFHVAHV